MFQRMSTHKLAESINGFVTVLNNLGDCVGNEDKKQIGAPGVARRKQKNHDGNNQQWEELSKQVRTEIAVALAFCELPIENTGDAESH